MAGITLEDAEAKLATWMTAEDTVATGQSYTIGSRSLTRADLSAIRESVEYWDNKVKRLSRGGISVSQVTPVRN